jgi:hypothetical protein
MPDRDYYEGRPLVDRLQAFAEHHFELRTRHISRYEHEMLIRATEALDQCGDGQHPRGTQSVT